MNNIVTLFQKLVQIDSPSGEEDRIAKYLFEYLKKYTYTVKKDKSSNIYAYIPGTGEPLFFAAHMDTVEPGKRIKPVMHDTYITSDGSTILGADNKASIACILSALEKLKSNHIIHRPIELVFTVCEETDNSGALNFDYSQIQSKFGYCFDSVSPVGSIIIASPFYERFDIKIIGKEAHASKPQEALNALLGLNKLLNSVTLGKIDTETTINIGTVNGGFVRNTIPGEIYLKGEIRCLTEKKLLNHKSKFTRILTAISKKSGIKFEYDFVRENPGYKFTSAQKHIIDTITDKMKTVRIKPEPLVAWGVSDANIFNNNGLVCFNLGDGVEYAHSRKERIKISDMEKLVNLMVQLAT